MIVYSVTVSIHHSREEEWVDWMKQVHIPDVMATGLFVESHFQTLLHPEPQDPEASTYNIQYLLESVDHLEKYQAEFAPQLQQAHSERYEGAFYAFRTILERI